MGHLLVSPFFIHPCPPPPLSPLNSPLAPPFPPFIHPWPSLGPPPSFTPGPSPSFLFIRPWPLPPSPPSCRRDIHQVDRPPLHLAILERILTGGHRTADGATADYYYLPISSRDLKKAFLLGPALDYVASAWPWWNKTQGARHIIPMEGA